MKIFLKRYAVTLLAMVVVMGSVALTASKIFTKSDIPSVKSPTAMSREFSPSELSEYDGSGKHQQLLLAFEGNIYDVTAGSEFYGVGGAYHFLAGTDATAMLHIAGGSIVREKYPIIGTLSK